MTDLSVRSPDGSTIGYTTVGSGPALVVVDGAGSWSGFNSQRPLAELLAPHLTVVTYDRRGRGASSQAGPWSIEREVEDLAAVIAAVGSSASVYGISSGALLALQASAAEVPIDRLVLFEPPIGDTTGPSQFTADLASLVEAGRLGDAAELFLSSIGVPPEVVTSMGPARAALDAVAATLVHDARIGDDTSLDVVRRVEVPTLVLDSSASTGDLTGWAAAVVGALPRGTHRSLAGEWHGATPDDIAPVVRDFLRT